MAKAKDHLTLKEFHKDFYPTLSQRKLSEIIGVNEGSFSKIKKGRDSISTPTGKKISDWMWYNHKVVLIENEPKFQAEINCADKYVKEMNKLFKRITELEDQVQDLRLKLAFSDQANGFVRYCERRAENNIKRRKKTGGK